MAARHGHRQAQAGHGTLRLACAIALVSTAALAWQLLLVRWLAIAHWHPFAVVIISLALLGHGASGTALALAREYALRRFDALFPACALAFSLAAALCLPLVRAIPFNGLELVWDPWQLGWLGALYLCLSVPFFFAAACFGLAFARHGDAIPRLYGADLLGAGVGALLALALLWWLPLEHALVAVLLLGPLAALLVAARGTMRAAALATAVVVLGLGARGALVPPVNEFKGLAKALLVRDARVIAQRHGPQGWIAVLASPRLPLRQVPGLSLSNVQEPAPQLGVFVDGDGPAAVTLYRDAASLAYLGRTTSALPYALRARPRVLVLGAGSGADVLQAQVLGARTIRAVERNPQLVALVRGPLDGYAGGLYRLPGVRVDVADVRGFVRADRARYDLVVLGPAASFAAGSAGVQAVAEDHALTVEALRDYYARLAPGGMLAVTRWEKQPPRDLLKLFATAVAALRAEGVRAPGASLVAIRNWDAATLVLKRGGFTRGDIARVRAFADVHGYDLVHHAGLRADDANRFHQLPRADAYLGAQALLSPRAEAYLRDYKFAIAPARDDRPYFGNFFKWATLPELWRLRAQGAAVLLDSGVLLLLAALAQALPLALLLVLLPLLALPRAGTAGADAPTRAGPPRGERLRVATYFTGLGLAFLLVEIACLARLGLVVGQPLLAFATGLSGFLLFAGLGSVRAQRWVAHRPDALPRLARRAVLGIALGLAWHAVVAWACLRLGAAAPVAVRAALALLSIAPLAFAMGMPFPLGLSRLAREAPALVPWAWGLNGCASVVAAILALLLALAIGLAATLVIALALYTLAVLAWPARAQTASARPGVRWAKRIAPSATATQ
jgi:hypothetical protein